MTGHRLATLVHRATLAAVEGNAAARDLALDELGECPCCLGRALKYSIALLSAEMSHDTWRQADAVAWLEHTILADLDHAAERRTH